MLEDYRNRKRAYRGRCCLVYEGATSQYCSVPSMLSLPSETYNVQTYVDSLAAWTEGEKQCNIYPWEGLFALDMMRMCSVLVCDELGHPKWVKYKHESFTVWVVMAKYWGKSKIKLKWLNWVMSLQLELQCPASLMVNNATFPFIHTERDFLIKPVDLAMLNAICTSLTTIPEGSNPLLNWRTHISVQSYCMY